MNCVVCQNPRQGASCRVCGFDNDSDEARDPAVVQQRRAAFRAGSLQPTLKVTAWDKLRPWAGVLLGFFIFATWMKACRNPGWPFW